MLVLSGIVAMVLASSEQHATWRSAVAQTQVLELFTSEGCSSCPPAERYMAALQDDPGLFKTIVPVQFHVDYWDRLGWPDALAKAAYTERQRLYARSWGQDSVYTPCFVRNGRPARMPRDVAGPGEAPDVGVLQVTRLGNTGFRVVFSPLHALHHVRVVGVVMAQHVKTRIRAGENRGRTLDHAFAALAAREVPLHAEGKTFVGTLDLPRPADMGALDVAFWVTADESMAPVQAVGGVWETRGAR